MKKTVIILCFCLLTVLARPLQAQSAQPFTVQKLDNVKFPWGLGDLSVVDGILHGRANGLNVVGEAVKTPLSTDAEAVAAQRLVVRLAPDTALARLYPEATFAVRNPADNHLYYTVTGKEGHRLFRGGAGSHGSVAIEFKGWTGEIGHPAFSPDGRFLVFSATATNGLGRHDLWCSRRDGDTWGAPVNLGSRINTQGDEVAPCFYDRYLIFASNGHAAGDTSYSLYSVAFTQAETDDQLIFYPYALQRLPEPLNSAASDRELAIDPQGGTGYWISSRDGHESLYCLRGRLEGIHYSGEVTGVTGKPVDDATVTAIVEGRTVAQTRTDAQGHYSLYLQPGTAYRLGIVAKGMRMRVDALPKPSRTSDSLFCEVRHDVRLDASPVGQPVILENLFGPATDVELTEKGCTMLMSVVQILRENDALRTELRLTSRATGDAEFDNMLNERRLNALREFFSIYISSTARISYVNDNSVAGLPAQEKQGDRLRVIFVE